MLISDWFANNNWAILLIIIGVVVVIGLLAFLIHKIMNRNKKDEKPTEEDIAKEDVERLLVDIEDTEETQKNEKEDNK